MSAEESQKQLEEIAEEEEVKNSTDVQSPEAVQLASQISELNTRIIETKTQMTDLKNLWNTRMAEMKSHLDGIERILKRDECCLIL
jgi:DNA polymerase III delta prime subunit